MESPEQSTVLGIANQYVNKITSFLEEKKEWWSAAQSWNNGNYTKTIIQSLDLASTVLNTRTNLALAVDNFRNSVTDTYRITDKIAEISTMNFRNIEEARSNNNFINDIARQTLAYFSSLQPPVQTQSSTSEFREQTKYDVSEIQRALKSAGFFEGVVDGIYGEQTLEAVQNFQIENRLKPTGTVDRDTYESLMKKQKQTDIEEVMFEQPSAKTNNLFVPQLASEGNHLETDDKLDFSYDIESLATIISLTDVKPPLAIGLFGNWGTGKSFFMEKLSQKIQYFANRDDDRFVKNIVHVKFNSWHYSDSNLWASLITEIFDSLNTYAHNSPHEEELEKLSKTLNITTSQRDAIEARKSELSDRKEKLINENRQKRNRLEDLSGINIFRLLISDKNIKNDLKSLQNEDVEKIIRSSEKLGECVGEFKKFKIKYSYLAKSLSQMKVSRWIGVLIIYLLIFAGTFAFKNIFPEEWHKITHWIWGLILAVTPAITNLIRLLWPALKGFNNAADRLIGLKETLDARPDSKFHEMEQIDSEIRTLSQSIENMETTIAQTQHEIDGLKSGRKLLEFIEKRTQDESYSRQLGLISWIRKDFCRLDELLRKQHELSGEDKNNLIENPHDVQLKIDRIILYIDDLDRCKEEIVVKVLEAIHLLLAFPLFVVVVGVDPRWLNNALSEKYKNLFGKHHSGETDEKQMMEDELLLTGVATTYDYLEKIFQIPFSLRQINSQGRKDLIEYLLRNEMEDENEVSIDLEKNLEEKTNDEDEKEQFKFELEGSSGTVQEPQEPADEQIERLTFLKDELECMQNISGLFGHSPRTINRFVNIYRIIKAHRKLRVTDEFSEDDFAPIMIVLSIMIGYSSLAQNFIDKLSLYDDRATFLQFMNEMNFPEKFRNEVFSSIHARVAALPVKSFKDNLELISRFSFRTFAVKVTEPLKMPVNKAKV